MKPVICGLDNLEKYDHLFRGKRLGLLTIPAAINAEYQDSIEVLSKRYHVTALFSPEHGVRGDKQAGLPISTYVDSHTGITAYSIYGNETHAMTQEQTELFDVLVYDIQDVGSRFYTFTANLKDCMYACAKAKKPFVVLDRPNPIGDKVEGNVPDAKYLSLVCAHTMPQRYGLTPGEFAQMLNGEQNINCELYVVPMEGYRRNMPWDETGLHYLNCSPNLPNMDGVFLYNGTCYFEGTTVSEGRGTTRPFEYIGAPWLDPFELADRMNQHNLPGVRFQPIYFTPTFSKHQGEVCGGVQVHVLDREALLPVDVGLWMLYECKLMTEAQGKDFWKPGKTPDSLGVDGLMCCDKIHTDFDPEALLAQWKKESAEFADRIEKYRIYR